MDCERTPQLNEEAMFMALLKGEIDMISNIRGTFGAIP
ncbi:unnamed protein product, partial [marine sediment metagenome]